jgi:hypothetical protein
MSNYLMLFGKLNADWESYDMQSSFMDRFKFSAIKKFGTYVYLPLWWEGKILQNTHLQHT